MNSHWFLTLLVLIALGLSTEACTCLSSDLPDAYHNPFAKRFVRAIPRRTYTNSTKRFYVLEIQQEYKACPHLPTTVVASTNLDFSFCGIILTLNTPYIMPLDNTGSTARINLCQVSVTIILLSLEPFI